MARTDRAYRKMMRRKTMLCAEKDYRDILLRDCQEQARKKTDTYRTQLMRELYTAHPDWIPAEKAGKIVFDSRMAQFDADMAFVRKQASTRAAKAISKDPACAEREEEKLQQLQKEHEELRNQYSCRLQQEISAQLTDMSGDGAEREAAVSDIERKVDAFRAEQEKAAQKQMETIRQAEDSKIQKLSDALGKLRLAPADRPGLPEGVVLRVQDLCMYFGGVHAVDGLSFDVKKGEIFGLIGPNGAGKTTVFNCITQFYKPTSGTLLFENKAGEVISLPEEKVHDVVLQGIVRTFQNVEVIREVSVLDNLLIAGHRQFTLKHGKIWPRSIGRWTMLSRTALPPALLSWKTATMRQARSQISCRRSRRERIITTGCSAITTTTGPLMKSTYCSGSRSYKLSETGQSREKHGTLPCFSLP